MKSANDGKHCTVNVCCYATVGLEFPEVRRKEALTLKRRTDAKVLLSI